MTVSVTVAGVEFDGEVAPGMVLTDAEGGKAGVVTSYTPTPSLGTGHFALAYVKCRKGGKSVRVEATQVRRPSHHLFRALLTPLRVLLVEFEAPLLCLTVFRMCDVAPPVCFALI